MPRASRPKRAVSCNLSFLDCAARHGVYASFQSTTRSVSVAAVNTMCAGLDMARPHRWGDNARSLGHATHRLLGAELLASGSRPGSADWVRLAVQGQSFCGG